MPEVVGPYRVVSQIGHGGMAVVYLARQPVLGRSVALKELAPFGSRDPSLAQRFIREARVAGSLNHPNVVTVFDFLEHDGVPYIAMEYLERGSLRPFVGRMSVAQVAGVLEGLLAALSHAEATGIVHRDVKPENLLITADGGIKIADFGIAKAYQQVATEEMLTPAGATVGTPAYMAPEQAMGEEIGPWTDLYQSGVVAYELLAGTVPFRADGAPVAVMMKHITEPVPPLPAGTDPALEAWVMRMLAKAPGERPPNARAAWNDLEEIVARTGRAAVAPRGPARRARADRRAPDAADPRALLVVAGLHPRRDPHATATAARARRAAGSQPARRSVAAGRAGRCRRDAGARAGDAGGRARVAGGRARIGGGGARVAGGRARIGGGGARIGGDGARVAAVARRRDQARDAGGRARDAGGRTGATRGRGGRSPDRLRGLRPGLAARASARVAAGCAGRPTCDRAAGRRRADGRRRHLPPPRSSRAAPASVPPPRPELHARTEAPTSPPPPETPRSRARPLVALALAALVLGLRGGRGPADLHRR